MPIVNWTWDKTKPCPCECGCCTNCDAGTEPKIITIDFTEDLNIHGVGCDCTRWIKTWNLPHVSQAVADNLATVFPHAYTIPYYNCCWYLCPDDTPCGSDHMSLIILPDGQCVITIVWSDTEYVHITCAMSATTNTNCKVNFNRAVLSAGIEVAGAVPCDFAWAAVGKANTIILGTS